MFLRVSFPLSVYNFFRRGHASPQLPGKFTTTFSLLRALVIVWITDVFFRFGWRKIFCFCICLFFRVFSSLLCSICFPCIVNYRCLKEVKSTTESFTFFHVNLFPSVWKNCRPSLIVYNKEAIKSEENFQILPRENCSKKIA